LQKIGEAGLLLALSGKIRDGKGDEKGASYIAPGTGKGTGKGTLIKIITFQKKSNVGNDTLFTLCLLLKEFFV
jgi:hypothetical protein